MAGDVFAIQGSYNLVDNVTEKLKRVQKDVKANGDEVSATEGKFSKFSNGVGGMAGKIAGAVGVAFSVGAIVSFGKKCLQSASDVEEMQNKFNVVFDGMQTEVDAWANQFSDAVGRNKNEIKTYLADNQNMFVGMGMTREAGADMSKQLVSLALDLASFNNLNEADAVEKMSKAIMGETESAKGLGAVLNENTRLMAMEKLGYTGKFEALSEAEKMQVNYQAILMQSADAVGDAERSAGSYANQMRSVSAKIQEFAQTVGSFFLPFATNIVSGFGTMVSGATDFVSKLGEGFAQARSTFEETGNTTEAFKTLFSNVFGIELPDSVIIFIDNMVLGFQNLWTTIQDIWTTISEPIFERFKDTLATVGEHSDSIFSLIENAWLWLTEAINDVWQMLLKPVFEAVMSIIDSVKKVFEDNWEAIYNVYSTVIGDIITIWNNNLKPMFQAISDFITNILAPVFKWLLENIISPIFNSILHTIKSTWENGIKPIFTGIIDFITGVFSGNWKQAWSGVTSIFSGIMGGLGSIMKAPLNAVIGLINKAISGINSISVSIPDWVPFVGGNTFGMSIPHMNYLEKGGILTEPTMLSPNVMAGEKNKGREAQAEAVIPLDRLFKELNRIYGQGKEIVLNIDGREFMRATAPYQSEYNDYNNLRSVAWR